jgi:phenylacetic acid degradation operon negative regulatory protein
VKGSKPKPRGLILDLLLAADPQPLSARDAVAACALFGISENNARVALARLSSEGLIEAAERGSYQLSARAHELADDVATWRTAEQRVRDWNGGYIVVHTGALGRSDRAALRARRRALDMLGFRELERGIHLRPDNIERDLDAVRYRLYQIGLERKASVFAASGFDAVREARVRRLWDGKALTANYRRLRQELEDWMRGAERLAPDEGAREAFLVGSRAIRHVVYDPLLPNPLVDVQARQTFVETVRRVDRLGHRLWQRMYEASTGQPGPFPPRPVDRLQVSA